MKLFFRLISATYISCEECGDCHIDENQKPVCMLDPSTKPPSLVTCFSYRYFKRL